MLRMTLLAATALLTLTTPPAFADSLPEPAAQALTRALEDERHAEAFYASVLEKFGDVRPFSNIIRAEQKHAAMLVGLMQAYGVDVPADPYKNGAKARPESPATRAAACKAGVEAEILNRDLYDKDLIPAVASYPDIVQVFQALRNASEQNHLPAFQRCGGGQG